MCNAAHKIRVWIPAGIVAGILLCLTACTSTPPPSSPPPPPPPPQAQQPPEESREQNSQSASQSGAEQAEQQTTGENAASGSQRSSPPNASRSSSEQNALQNKSSDQDQASPQLPSTNSQEEQLDGEFQRSLSKFDKRLERENAELGELTREQADSENEGGSSSENEDVFTGNAPFPPRVPDASGVPGSPGDQARIPPPDDVGDGQDDDIVARQLREAAEAETDPELREKLWEEYRAYKRNQ